MRLMDWNASTGGVIFSSPAIGADGSIYIGSNDNKLHAFNPDGSGQMDISRCELDRLHSQFPPTEPSMSVHGIIKFMP